MKEIIFATHNKHKLQEIQSILKDSFTVLGLEDMGYYEEIPETAQTLSENASLKSQCIYKHFSSNCFADDTGLEVAALGGKPGVYSARYAGEDCIAEHNMMKVLEELKGVDNRKARFVTIISLWLNGQEHLFEGSVSGSITHEKHGEKGFGYDPIFIPDGYEQSFAEMPAALKNATSHRALAVKKLAKFLVSH